MKNLIITIFLLIIMALLTTFVVSNWRGVVNDVHTDQKNSLQNWKDCDKVANPLLYVAHLRKSVEIKRGELLHLIEQYDDQNNKYEFELRKLKSELPELLSFLAEAKKVYRKGCGTVDIGGITYSEVDFLRISVEKDKRRKEVVEAIDNYTSKFLQNSKIGKSLAERALEKLLREERRLNVLSEDLAISKNNDKVLSLIKELDDISLDVDALPIDRMRKELRFAETEVERIIREGGDLFNAKAN